MDNFYENLYKEDLKALMYKMKKNESLLRLKRRWMIDIPLSMVQQKRIEETLPGGDKIMPESFIREGDPKCEEVRACIEMRLLNHGKKFHGTIPLDSAAQMDYDTATHSVMNVLDKFPFITLRAMYRKLTGVENYTPSFGPVRDGETRSELISRVEKLLLNMLADFNEFSGPTDRLADALAVAGLHLKLMNRRTIQDFRTISSRTKLLQNEIVDALSLLKRPDGVRMIELKKVQFLLGLDYELPVKIVRTALRNLLIDYLFECNDQNSIPDCVLQSIRIINTRLPSRGKKSFSRGRYRPPVQNEDVVQKEIEHVLTLSAQAKEVISSLLPELELEENDEYVEEFEGSDSFCTFYDDKDEFGDSSPHSHLDNSCDEEESIGETNHKAPSGSDLKTPLDSPIVPEIKFVAVHGSVSYKKACDVTSMVAHDFVSHVLDTLANSQGLEICEGSQGSSFVTKFQEIWRNVIEQ